VTILRGLRVHVEALGCRSNQYEAEALADGFLREGAMLTDQAPWDVAVVVSCAVTAVADGKTRQLLRRLRRSCPGGLLVVTGCWAQKAAAEDLVALPVDLLVGNGRKAEIPQAVSALISGELPSGTVIRDEGRPPARWDGLRLTAPHLRSRAFVKVQDGCDHFCSYCIIPFLRGRPVSRPLDEVVTEVRTIVSGGCPEVVLTGIHLGLYGRDLGVHLGDLVRALSDLDGLARLRFGSLEPFALDEDLLESLVSSRVFCPHLHLPLQSGDDEILDRMRRGYRSRDFRDVVARLRRHLGQDLHISTDLLVGFPGESEEAFRRSLDLVEELSLGRLHVFPFSPRRGTAAASFPDRPSPEVIKERCRRAVALGGRLLSRYARRWIGREVTVVVESCGSSRLRGLTAHYVDVEVPQPSGAAVNDLISVRVDKEQGGRLRAVFLP
jgi:threonylcarbamoyladenosine tRNA methylthiotransferase MtaB